MASEELTEPVQDGSDDASANDKILGIVEQVRQDLAIGHADDARALVEQRLKEAGVDFEDDDLDDLAEKARTPYGV